MQEGSALRNRILVLLCLSTVINYVDRQALSVVLPGLRDELGLTSADYGNITTAFLIAYTIGQFAMGMLTDRIGSKAGLVIAVVVWSLAAVGHAVAGSAAGLLVLRCILGIGESGNWPAGSKAVSEWFPKERRAFAMGVFDGGSALGAIVAPPLMAALVTVWGWRAAFVVTGMMGFVWLVAWIIMYPPRGAQRTRVGEGRRFSFELFRVRQLWGLMATRMLATPVWWFYVFWLPDYLARGRGFGLKEIGLFAWIPYLTVDIGKLTGGALSDRLLKHGRSATMARKSVMAAAALCMMGGLFVVNAPTAASALAWVSLATFGFGMWSANILALHADVFPSEFMATAIGWTGMASSFGGAVFTWSIGQLVDRYGYGLVFNAAGIAPLLGLMALLLIVGRVEARLQPERVLA